MAHVAGISPPGSSGPSFEEPFEMLGACHQRVDRMLALLDKMRSQMRDGGADENVRQASRDVMRYFDKAAPQHHRDEELHVFPVLIGMQDEALVRLVARLQTDHQLMDARWAAARSLLEEVEIGARSRFNDADEAVFDAFVSLYAEHMRVEEDEVFPRAREAIDETGGNQQQAARRLGLSRQGLINKMKRYGIG